MNCESTGPEEWRLILTEPEGEFLVNVLARLGRQYQADVARMSPALRAYWQGTISRNGIAGKEEELKDSQEMLAEARGELRAERLALVENWLSEYELAEVRDPWIVELTGTERDEFISMLNDRRMMLAAEMEITEQDMEAAPNQISDEQRRVGILEIDVLGHFILALLGPQIYRP
jgi:hypothetical protein